MDKELSRLQEEKNLRKIWKEEPKDFTTWLAKDENLELLADTLSLDLELKDTEVDIGKYSADLVVNDISGDRIVVIENQLEKTNHKHLGQIITYASGLGADIVVWICKEVEDEHRKALDWLNEITDKEIAFFALEIELWKIKNSPLAPKFNIVCSPNEWSKVVKASQKEISETKLLQKRFWSEFKNYVESKGSFLKLRTPLPQTWYSIAIGRSKFKISLVLNTEGDWIRCELYIRHRKAQKAFDLLKEEKEEIEREIGEKSDWQEDLPRSERSKRIALYKYNCDIFDEDRWEEYFDWLHKYAEKFYKVFSDRVKNLEL